MDAIQTARDEKRLVLFDDSGDDDNGGQRSQWSVVSGRWSVVGGL
jgi:hypothetical protein